MNHATVPQQITIVTISYAECSKTAGCASVFKKIGFASLFL